MNLRQHMIIDNQTNKIITPDVVSCKYNSQSQRYDVVFKSGKSFPYGYNRITWLKDPKVFDPALYHIAHSGREFFGITAIYVFTGHYQNYWHICFQNGSERDYREQDLSIIKSCLSNAVSKNVFVYLKKMADLSDLRGDDGTKLLSKHYEKLTSFIGEDTALATYLNPSSYKNIQRDESVPIFPFGCNASQYKAVKAALDNQLSVIQGPPGTGKTQTVLNIIANLLVSGKTIQVVSNNEPAITNILEKLSSSKYGMDFLVALLGKSDNKKDFLKNQTGVYPDLSNWNYTVSEESVFNEDIRQRSMKLNEIFQKQEQLALAKQELQELKTEQRHFEQYTEESNNDLTQYKIRRKLKSKTLMRLWQECQSFSEIRKSVSFFFKVRSYIVYGISDWNFYKVEISKIINMFQNLYYQARMAELTDEIEMLEHVLAAQDSKRLADEFANISMTYLKSVLYKKYGGKNSRPIFDEEDLWRNPSEIQKEYPIVLSTTFSSRSSLCKDASYDYLIMDEASQVDIATGALALSCAKNAVIVGDTKQLPNIVGDASRKVSDAIFESFNIDEGYRYSQNSFLQSICNVLPAIPQTLLREHYRCHPKIINFCNHKFYNGELVIMTPDNGEDDVISVIKTAVGDHERDRMNQRQIDSVVQEVLPQLHYGNIDLSISLIPNVETNAEQNTTQHQHSLGEDDAQLPTGRNVNLQPFAEIQHSDVIGNRRRIVSEYDYRKSQKGRNLHDSMVNLIAQRCVANGASVFSDPRTVDLCARYSGYEYLIEVKSITPSNFIARLRYAIGQVHQYNYLLPHTYSENRRLVLAFTAEIPDNSWSIPFVTEYMSMDLLTLHASNLKVCSNQELSHRLFA